MFDKVTIFGAVKEADVRHLVMCADRYPFLEFGITYGVDYRNGFVGDVAYYMKTLLRFPEKYTKQALQSGDLRSLQELVSKHDWQSISRLQLRGSSVYARSLDCPECMDALVLEVCDENYTSYMKLKDSVSGLFRTDRSFLYPASDEEYVGYQITGVDALERIENNTRGSSPAYWLSMDMDRYSKRRVEKLLKELVRYRDEAV